MKTSKLIVVAVVWAASLVGVGLWAQGGSLQTPEGRVVPLGGAQGPVLSGDNIGFQRVTAQPDPEGRVVVKLMVKVNGEWHEATTSQLKIVR